ncbi:hypothetical protein [Terrihabitans rhizophilus]|uniref:LVIVD repeat-containing protein n=1 Tax=Terrihabitans rhizophilus TaxID=3092662 RepID=A0ABU4RMT7_9HYPH|nr:hypothetical protein [Terrihabitans sp. PJ23]MDX6805543.1 hypothetical protein [Terrihabitans sp. PJ23]
MTLLSQDTLRGFGAIGEGMSMQIAGDSRRILWIAHEGPPKNFSAVDVSDPRTPKVICQTELPHNNMRSNSLEVCGNLMAVAYQVSVPGQQPAGIEIFDISTPETPRSISFYDTSGPHSRGVHCLWFVDGEYIHASSGSADFMPRHPRDDQFYQIIDVRDPTRPHEVGRWWYPGTRKGDVAPPPARVRPQPMENLRGPDAFRLHNANVYPERPDRAYIGYIDGGAFVLDISDKSDPRVVSSWNPHPPYPGFTHTVMPLLERGLLVVTDECVQDDAEDWPKLTWMIDARVETNLVPIATFPMPPVEEFGHKGGRFGSHNIHENRPGPSFRSEEIIFGCFFNAGIRIFDIKNPYRPEEIACFIPPGPAGSRVPTAQMNEIYVDDRGVIYSGDRWAGGLYTLEADI